ncbi:MAG: response regulator [Lachnospiraceae bacterium]|nr:response regulator [Lachnospiraceae bacterium]
MPNKAKEGFGEIISKVSGAILNILLCSGIVLFLYAALAQPMKGEPEVGNFAVEYLNDGWELSGLKDGEKQIISLPASIERDALKGSTVIISRTLPENLDDGMNLLARSIMQDMVIYIDGAERVSYRTNDFVEMSEHLPSAFLEVPISSKDSGKTISIVITHKKRSAVAIEKIAYGYGGNTWYSVFRDSFATIVIATILIIFGTASIISYVLIRNRIRGRNYVFYLARILLIAGLWILGESELRQMFFGSPVVNTIFSYIFIETITAFGAMFFNSTQNYEHSKLYSVMIALIAFQSTLNLILQFAGIADLYETLIVSHILSIATLAVTAYSIIADIRNGHIRRYREIAIGMVFAISMGLFEVISFYTKPNHVFGVFLGLGLVALVFASFIQTLHDEVLVAQENVKLAEAEEIAQAASDAKGKFLASMSHEIRTPVNAIVGLGEMIDRETEEEKTKAYVADIKSASSTLLDLINDILDLSKLESGKMDIIESEYRFADMLAELYRMMKFRADDKMLDLTFEVDSELPTVVIGDTKRIRQILINLLTNAVKYTEKGYVKLSASLIGTDQITGEEGNTVNTARIRISVKDTGMGIKHEDIGRLTDKYVRVDERRNRNIEGTGLGLAITCELLNLMGSELKLESVYGKGSDFGFELVQKVKDATPLGKFDPDVKPGRKTSGRKPSFTIPEARILICDDNDMNIKVFSGLLKNMHPIIYKAASGKACLDMVEKEDPFDLIFLDHMMPEMDGIMTFERLCKMEGFDRDKTKVIILTANVISGARQQYMQTGFDDYLEKPVIPAALEAMIEKYLDPSKIVRKEDEEG